MHARTALAVVSALALALTVSFALRARAAAPPPPPPPAKAREALEREVLAEVNRMRADPVAYSHLLEATRGSYQGTLYVRGGALAPIKTIEGVAAVDEAIAALRGAPALGPLTPSQGLALAARDQVIDEGPTGVVGHAGTDGSNSFQRMQRHGRTTGLSGEVIDYGWTTAREIVIDLLVDDGIANRGHRRALLRALYAQAGVACGEHSRFGMMCVMDMAESFTPHADDATVVASDGAR